MIITKPWQASIPKNIKSVKDLATVKKMILNKDLMDVVAHPPIGARMVLYVNKNPYIVGAGIVVVCGGIAALIWRKKS